MSRELMLSFSFAENRPRLGFVTGLSAVLAALVCSDTAGESVGGFCLTVLDSTDGETTRVSVSVGAPWNALS